MKKIISMTLVLCLISILGVPAKAASVVSNVGYDVDLYSGMQNIEEDKPEIWAELYNKETKEKVVARMESDSAELIGFTDEGDLVMQSDCEIEVYIPEDTMKGTEAELFKPMVYSGVMNPVIPEKIAKLHFAENSNEEMVLCDSKGKTKWDGSYSVKASLTITYNVGINGSDDYVVKMNKVNGSWTISDKSVTIKSRQVDIYHNIPKNTDQITIYPRTNTFTQTVSFGSKKWAEAMSEVGATSIATLDRGTGGQPWELRVSCTISSNDF